MNRISIKHKSAVWCILLIAGILAYVIDSPVLLFVYCTMLWGLISLGAKFSFFTEVSFILLFSYLQAVMRKVFGNISGSTLAWAGVRTPFYFAEMTVAIMSFLLILLWFVWFTKLIEREKAIYQIDTGLTNITGSVFLIISVVLVLLVFPSFPSLATFSSGTRARNEAVPYGLVLLALMICALTFDFAKKRKAYYIVYALISFWILGHGERVEILGFLSYAALKALNAGDSFGIKKDIQRNKKIMIFLGGAAAVILSMWIGLARSGAHSTITPRMMFYNLIVQGTCGDVVYCFNCAIDMWKNGNGLYGYTYLDYLVQLVPGLASDYALPQILIRNYGTMGGALFFSEPMANFGMVGVVVFNVEFCVVMNMILKKATHYRAWIWIPVVTEIFRTCWYGRSGWILAVFVEIPILYFGCKYFLNRCIINSCGRRRARKFAIGDKTRNE